MSMDSELEKIEGAAAEAPKGGSIDEYAQFLITGSKDDEEEERTSQNLSRPRMIAIQTVSNQGESLRLLMRIIVKDEILADADVFIPYRLLQYKVKGGFEPRKKALYPGYLFAYLPNERAVDALFLALKNVPKLSIILNDQQSIAPFKRSRMQFYTLKDSECDFIMECCGNPEHTIKLSEAVILTDEELEKERQSALAGQIEIPEYARGIPEANGKTYGRSLKSRIRFISGYLSTIPHLITDVNVHKRTAWIRTGGLLGLRAMALGFELRPYQKKKEEVQETKAQKESPREAEAQKENAQETGSEKACAQNDTAQKAEMAGNAGNAGETGNAGDAGNTGNATELPAKSPERAESLKDQKDQKDPSGEAPVSLSDFSGKVPEEEAPEET